MLKITGGQWRGRNISAPRGLAARPTQAKAREAIFSMLHGAVEGARTLDLFAGAGTLGFEALSRGADSCVFVDANPRHLDLIRRTAEALGCAERCALIRARLPKGLEHERLSGRRFDLVFMDPPYEKGFAESTLDALTRQNILSQEAVVMVETRRGEPLAVPEGWAEWKKKRYGDTDVRLLRRGG